MGAITAGFPIPCEIPLAADASDDRAVTRVEFYVNDQLVGSDSDAPYGIDLPADHPALVDPGGSNTAYARAYDNDIPPSLGTSPRVTFFQVVPPPSLGDACGQAGAVR